MVPSPSHPNVACVCCALITTLWIPFLDISTLLILFFAFVFCVSTSFLLSQASVLFYSSVTDSVSLRHIFSPRPGPPVRLDQPLEWASLALALSLSLTTRTHTHRAQKLWKHCASNQHRHWRRRFCQTPPWPDTRPSSSQSVGLHTLTGVCRSFHSDPYFIRGC